MTGVRLTARLLGTFEVAVDGRAMDRGAFERPSGLRLIKLVLATPGHRLRREAAAELLWPESDPERSGASLRKAIHFARRGLADLGAGELVVADGDWLGLAPDVSLDADVDRLAQALDRLGSRDPAPRAGDDLDTVAALGASELLPEDPYEEWLVPIRERLRQRVTAATTAGIATARARGDLALAERLVDVALTLDPADETAHRSAIEIHLEAGRIHAARRQLAACRRALAETYEVEPSSDLVALVDAAAADRATRRVAGPAEREIIGRRIELDRIEPELDAVAAGAVGAVLIRGAAGIGKSRLLREVVRLAGASGWLTLDLRGVEQSVDTAFAALGQAIAGTVDPVRIAAWPEPARSAALTITPSLVADGSPPSIPLVPFATDAGLRAGLVAALRRLAVERPLVLAVDDLQWLDEPTLALLRAALALEGIPLLVAAGLRDEPREPGNLVDTVASDFARRGGTEIRLPALGTREIQLLVERELDGSVADSLVTSLHELSGGTPLYALQLLRGGRERGTIAVRDGAWRHAVASGSLPIPEGVQRVVFERVSRLAPTIRAILVVAAELGDEVSFELLVAATGEPPETVLDALDDGIEHDLLMDQNGRYRFSHPLYRAALRGGLPRRRRAGLHARIAMALAGQVDPTNPGAVSTAIAAGTDLLAVATHAARAVALGVDAALPLAVGFGFSAGARQHALFDHAGAAATLREAIALWHRLPAGRRSAFPISDAHQRLGQALKATGDQAGAADAFRAAAAAATSDMDRARAYAALSWLPYEHGRFDRSADVLREGLAVVEDPVARAYLESGLGWIRGRQGDWVAAHDLLTPAIETLERGGPADLLARALDRLAVAIRDLGRADRSVPVFQRALALCQETGNLHDEAIVRMHLASALRDIDDVAGARPQVERAIELTRMTGDRYIEAVSHWILAEVEHTDGRLDAAATARRSELRILEALGGNPQNQAMAHAHLAHLAARAGDDGTAAAEAETARSIAAHAGLDYLPALVERAIVAVDWFRVSHRHADAEVEAAATRPAAGAAPARPDRVQAGLRRGAP